MPSMMLRHACVVISPPTSMKIEQNGTAKRRALRMEVVGTAGVILFVGQHVRKVKSQGFFVNGATHGYIQLDGP